MLIFMCGLYHNTPDSDAEKLPSFHSIQPSCVYLLLGERRSEHVLHTGQLGGKEEDLVEGSSMSEATEEPASQLHAERDGHHTKADHFNCPHHRHFQITKSC